MNLENKQIQIKRSKSAIFIQELFSKSIPQNAPAAGSMGIDIGSSAVKIARLETGRDGVKLLGVGVEKIVDKNVRDAVSKALVKAKAATDQPAVISLSGQGVVSRYIELPVMNKNDLESSMKFEIEKYVPFSMADVTADFAVIQEMKDKAKMSILIAAAKNDIISKKTALAKEMGLGLKAVDLDCLALANFFTEFCGAEKKGSCVGIINLGRSVCHINVLVDGIAHLSRDIFLGGDDLTKKMAEALEVDYVDAEKLKLDPGKRLDELEPIWDQVLNNLAAEIRVSLDYFEARMNRSVDKIYMTGGSSRLSGLEAYMGHALGIDTKKLDFSDRLLCDESVDRAVFKKDADLLAVALGLALR
jgi:type IV pilus assembly protein PilM